MPLATVSGILSRIGMGKLGRPGLEPAVRCERERPGELVHIDIKRLGRIQQGPGSRMMGDAVRSKRPVRKDPLGVKRQTAGWECVARPRAGSACTRLMTAPAWPTPKFFTIRAAPPSSVSSNERSRSTHATASPSSACPGSCRVTRHYCPMK